MFARPDTRITIKNKWFVDVIIRKFYYFMHCLYTTRSHIYNKCLFHKPYKSKKDTPLGIPYLYKLCVVTQQTNGLKKKEERGETIKIKNIPWLVILQQLVIPGILKLRLHCCSYPPGDSIVQLHSIVQLLCCDHEFHYTVG